MVAGLLSALRQLRIGAIVADHIQGYVWVRRISGKNPFPAYGVVNDGGAAGRRSGDGAFVPPRE